MIQDFHNIQVVDDVERLLILRKRLNKNQHEFARIIGVSRSYLGQVERKEVPFSPSLLKKIENYLEREKNLYEKDLFSSR